MKILQFLLFGLFLTKGALALECYQCDSSDNPECATRPGQQIDVEECPQENDECVTVIVATHTRRGCLSRLFPNKYCPAPCQRCKKSLCNKNIFPEDRLRCYQCSGAACVNVDKKTDYILPCPNYHEKDRCFTNILHESNVLRGCEYTNLPSTCPHVCLKCNYDGCNKEPGLVEGTCLECSHTFATPNPYCMRSVLPLMSDQRCSIATFSSNDHHFVKTCTNKVLHGHRAKCFTYINPQTGVAQRGCSTTKPFFPSGNLTECYGKNCNNGCLPISCGACNATRTFDNRQCRTGLNLRNENCGHDAFSCFACESSNVLRRGCSNSSFIPSTNEACYYCSDSDGCNSKHSPRTCFHCSSKDSADCASATWDLKRIRKRQCSSQLELCVSTVVNKFNMVYVLRGCESDVPDCGEFDPYCVRCNGSLCNSVPIEWENKENRIQLWDPYNGEIRNGGEKAKLRDFGSLILGFCVNFLIKKLRSDL